MSLELVDSFCKAGDDKWDPFPTVDDFEEIEVGDLLFVATQVKKKSGGLSQDTEVYYLPAKATKVEDERVTFVPFDSHIWEGDTGYEEITEFQADRQTPIRCLQPNQQDDDDQDEDHTIEDCYDVDIEEVLELCGEALASHADGDKTLMKAFKLYILTNEKDKDGKPVWHPLKWAFLKMWMKRLCRLKTAKWKEIRPANPEALTEAEASFFKDEFYDPVAAELKEQYKDSETYVDIAKMLPGLRTSVNMKYITFMIDLAASKDGPSPVFNNPSQVSTPAALPGTQALEDEMQKLKTSVATLAAQLRLTAVIAENKGKEAGLIKMKPNGNCLPQAMQIFADAIIAGGVNGKILMSPSQENKARAVVLYQAQLSNALDPSEFCARHGETFEEYFARHTAPANAGNYHDHPEMTYFVKEYKDLELRPLKKDGEGKVRVTSTLKEGECPRKYVGFVDLDAVHYDVGAVKDTEQGTLEYLFKYEDADKAQRLLVASKEAGHKTLVALKKPTPVAPAAPAQSKADFLQNTMDTMMGEKRDNGTASNTKTLPSKETQDQQIDLTQATMNNEQDRAHNAILVEGLRQELKSRDNHFNSQLQHLTNMMQMQRGQQAQAMQAMQTAQQQQSMQHQQQKWQVPFLQQQPTPPSPWPARNVQQQPPLQAPPPSWPAQKTLSQPANQNQPRQAWQGNHSMGVANGLYNSYNQLKSSGVNQWGFSAQQQQQKSNGMSKAPSLNRDEPAVVVFGEVAKDKLKQMLKDLSPTAYAAMVGAVQPKTGAPRYILTAKAHNVMQVQTLVPLLNAHGIRAANFENKRTGQAPRSQAALGGLQANANQSGVCKYFAAQTSCPFARCKYICWQRQ